MVKRLLLSLFFISWLAIYLFASIAVGESICVDEKTLDNANDTSSGADESVETKSVLEIGTCNDVMILASLSYRGSDNIVLHPSEIDLLAELALSEEAISMQVDNNMIIGSPNYAGALANKPELKFMYACPYPTCRCGTHTWTRPNPAISLCSTMTVDYTIINYAPDSIGGSTDDQTVLVSTSGGTTYHVALTHHLLWGTQCSESHVVFPATFPYVPEGIYFLRVISDIFNACGPSAILDWDDYPIQVIHKADLLIPSATMSSGTTLVRGVDSITVTPRVQNDGSSTAPANYVQIWLSNSTEPPITGYPIGAEELFPSLGPNGEWHEQSFNRLVPAVTPKGTYGVWIICDVDNLIEECDGYNNYYLFPQTVNIVDPPPPQGPSNLAHTACTPNSITWSWTDNSNNETGFRGHDSSHNAKWTVGSNITSATESGFNPNTQYTRHVHAYNAYGESEPSNSHSVYTKANVPSGASFSNVTGNSIQANWTSNGNPAGTECYCENTTIDTNSGWTTNVYWIDNGLSETTNYCYRVRARNGEGIETQWVDLGCESTLFSGPEINIKQNETEIPNGIGNYDFGELCLGWSPSAVFTIENLGDVDLDLIGSPRVEISGTNAGVFLVTQQPQTPVPSKGSVIFEIMFSPDTEGLLTAIVTIANNDFDENPFTFSITGTAVPPSTIYVDDDAVGDPGPSNTSVSDPCEDGSVEHPFDAIQEAIDEVVSGAIVVVLDGTYTGFGNRDIDIQGKAIMVRSENGPKNCTIDCNHYSGFYFHSREDANSIVTGFTITDSYPEAVGCYDNSSPMVTNCVLNNNRYGIYCNTSSNPVIDNCIISNNRRSGVYCKNSSSPTIRNCIIRGNLENGIVCSNYCNVEISNCTISGNHSGGWFEGGGVLCIDGSLIICCSTIVGNFAADGGGILHDDSELSVCNCILWDNRPDQITAWGSGTHTVTYSNISGGWFGIGNIDTEPNFVVSGYWQSSTVWVDGDYHLSANSLCIDAGDPNYVSEPNETDLAGRPRIVDGDCNSTEIVDMGAYEFSYAYIGDLDGQCDIDFVDFAILADQWLEPPGNPSADIAPLPTGDGIVNFLDFAVLAQNWLEGTTL